MRLSILIVEDDYITAINWAQILEDNGYTAIIAHTGSSAVEEVRKSQIDLILMDIHLGENQADGVETAKKILQDYDIPIIFLTNATETEIIKKTSQITPYGYILKNSNPSIVLITIESAFRLIEKQKKAQGHLQYLIENLNDIIYSVNETTKEFSYLSPAFTKVLGYTQEDISAMGGRKSFLSEIIQHKEFDEQEKLLKLYIEERSLDVKQHISLWKCADGTEKYIEDNWVPIYRNGKIESAFGVLRDVTERVRNKKKLAKTLEEKNILMQELDHRVKNNLSLITSLIHFKSEELTHENINLSDLEKQVVAIGMVHSKLFQKNQLSRIYFKKYAQELLENVFFSLTNLDIKIINTIEDIHVTAKHAVPLGLVINEIAINAIKHGFTSDRKAEFTISMNKEQDSDTCVMKISNNGKPFPEDVEVENPHTLGFRLIFDLLDPLQATLHLKRKPHPEFTFRITLS